jgi:hypothetical protein
MVEVLNYTGQATEHIGYAQTTLGEIVSKRAPVFDLLDRSGTRKTGMVELRGEEVAN